MRKKLKFQIVGYLHHLVINWITAFNALLLFVFHFIHGVLPVKYTSHEFWKISLSNNKSKMRT
jgi:hypothetical protein